MHRQLFFAAGVAVVVAAGVRRLARRYEIGARISESAHRQHVDDEFNYQLAELDAHRQLDEVLLRIRRLPRDR